MNDLALFDPAPEPWRADPVTTVRERTRRLRKPDTGLARNSDPITSHLAAALPGKTILKWRYLVALVEGGPQTDFDIAKRLGVQQTSCGPRRPSLIAEGFVEATGEMGRAPSGARAALWRATPLGIVKARELREAQ